MNDRIKWIDSAKGLAMICVVLGHMSIGWMDDIVFAFHMPIFFVLSGYMMGMRHHTVNGEYVQNKFRSLMKPYFITCFCIICMDVINNNLLLDDARTEVVTNIIANDLIRGFFASGTIDTFGGVQLPGRIGAIWFLPAMFFSVVVSQYMINRFDMKRQFAVAGLLLSLGIISRDFIWLPFSIQAACSAVIFIIIGYYMKDALFVRIKLWIALPVLVLGIILKYSHIYIVTAYYEDPLFSIITAVAGIAVIVWIAKRIENFRLINYIGKHSLIFLCVHLFEMETMQEWFRDFIQFMKISEEYCLVSLIIIKFIFIIGITMILAKVAELSSQRKTKAAVNTVAEENPEIVMMMAMTIMLILLGIFPLNGTLLSVINSVGLPALTFGFGYLSQENNVLKGIKVGAVKLLLPYAACIGILAIVGYIKGDVREIFTTVENESLIYILFVLFIVKSIYLLVNHFVSEGFLKGAIFLVISFGGYILGKNGFSLPLRMDIAFYALAYFCLGRLFREKNYFSYLKNNFWCYFVLSSVWVYMLYSGGLELSVRSYNRYTVGVAGSIAGVCILYLASYFLVQLIKRTGIIRKIIMAAGQNIISIICVQSILGQMIEKKLSNYLDREYIYWVVAVILLQIVTGICVAYLLKTFRRFRMTTVEVNR